MSVMLISPASFKRNVYSLSKFSPVFNYGQTAYLDTLEPIFETLQKLNARSFSERYAEPVEIMPYKEVSRPGNHPNLCALLKSLQCLEYNIELDEKGLSFDERRALKYLRGTIEAIKSHLISELPEMKEAAWC